MATKKRNKKYNPKTSKQALIRQAFKNIVITFVTGQDDKCNFVNTKTKQKVTASQAMVTLLSDYPHFWTLHLAGFGIKKLADGTMKDFMETETIRTTNRYYQRDLVDFFNERHQKLLKSMNQDRLCGAGWIASMNDQELDEETQIKIYSKLGAWT
tara:strand:- start:11173 stop:11637 length:465 start_codon:yes stop_codon:yes gene_type:complete